MDSAASISRKIKSKALELGFEACGISRVEELKTEGCRLEQWLKACMHGEMSYMKNHFSRRTNPAELVPGARSVIAVLKNYHTERKQKYDGAPVISKYAYGEDYHLVMRPKLRQLLAYIEEHTGPVNGRGFVDSAPILERAWAVRAGLGWMGKHSLILNRIQGSFFFLGTLIVDLELEPDGPVKDYCGTCTKCIDACPTGAIVAPYVVDSRKCISYLTIEKKGSIPVEFKGKLQNRVFGCDICQDVCPWNKNAHPHQEKAFEPKEELLNKSQVEWHNLSEEEFYGLFNNSSVKRTKFNGFIRNLDFLKEGD